jgi:magnesium-transporting ATPase (P-type)
MPIALAGGLGVTAIGLLRGQPLVGQLALGLSVALAAVPEGLPLLAGAGEATTARRLARRHAIVRRLASVEALGRVDIACVDKTGTLTEGRLALRALATLNEEAAEPPPDGPLHDLLRAAALASPHPDAWAAARDGTDLAILRAAEEHGLREDAREARDAEVPFQPTRPFQAARVKGRVYVKGAPEVLLTRCRVVRVGGEAIGLDDEVRAQLTGRARTLAARGLRVLLVAEGESTTTDLADPRDLAALGFVALADPLRAEVAQAVQRCREAGVRVIMLTGDHPETACAIARDAMLLDGGGVLTGAQIAELDDAALAAALEHTTVVARARPLDKLRIVEALRTRGHTVAMTGDGVNDAPALRLADIGVAMGRSGTEVARQAADVILADDDFSTLVEALVEGRGFWRNLRRSVGLLLGGNLGELGLLVGTSALGLGAGLSVRQVLAVNLVTDLLPGLAVVSQPPAHRRLSELQREGVTAFAGPLRADVMRRAVATAVPSLGAALLAGITGSDRRSVAFATVVGTQLAQTLELGRADGTLAAPVVGAVGLSAAALLAAFALPAGRSILQLVIPSPAGAMLILGGSLAAPLLNNAVASFGGLDRVGAALSGRHETAGIGI